MAAPLRVGIVGWGQAARTFHAPLIGATPGFALTAVASRDAAKVHAALGSAVEVLDAATLLARQDIDLVVIATPNDLHHPQALAALQAGRHVVVDKPFALDAAQAMSLIDAARQNGRLLSVFHNRRWDSDFLTLRQLLHEGRIGRPVELVSHYDRFRPQVLERWREAPGPGGGLWVDLGAHLVDQALQLFGAPAAITLQLATARDGARADDAFDARLRWAEDGPWRGLRARLHASTLAAWPGARFTLHGTAGSFTVDGIDAQEAALQAGAGPARIQAAGWGADARPARLRTGDGRALHEETIPLRPGNYPAYYAGLRDALLGIAANPVTPESALAVQQLLDAGRRSALARREILLDDGAG